MDSLTMDNVEQLTLAELRELQTKRLKQTLTFVYENSPVYKKSSMKRVYILTTS